MILESHIGEKTILQIECESDTGIHKGGTGARLGHPDRVLDAMNEVVRVLHNELLMKIQELGVREAEVEFGLHVDMSGNVTVGLHPADAQVRVRLRL